MNAYSDFLARKAIVDPPTGIDPSHPLPEQMFPFQADITKWALRRGRAALFAGTGLGKSFMELAWADAVHKETGKDILHLAPLAVSNQLAREAEKFGIAANIAHSGAECGPGINITNYQKLQHFDLSAFGGVILDESSILKSTDGHYRTKLIEACQSIPFRLAATATPAPNDFMELGNHAEFLGIMSYTDMLATFFTHDAGETQKWRLKGHAENEFWKWMASWAVMLRKPSDLGYSDEGYDLPPLRFQQHTASVDYAPSIDTGLLFPMQAETLQERIGARRATVEHRVALAFSVVIGSLEAKLAEWSGSQNTPNADAPSIAPMRTSANDENHKGATRCETLNTCENITAPTGTSSSDRQSSKRKSTAAAASVMPLTPSSESSASKPLASDQRRQGASEGSSQNTEWTPPNTTLSQPSRADDAPFAAPSQSDISTLTTAIQVARSEGSFAARAIAASDISRMTQSGLIEPWCIWCNLNDEQNALAKLFGPLAYSVTGSMPDDDKEAAILAWMSGERPIMLSKPQIMGFGMNFQHCRNTLFIGLNDSFEQFYQAVRRFWRFGQTKPVNCHIISSEIEGATVANIRRKEIDADRMAAAMVMHMADLSSQAVRGSIRDRPNYDPQQPVQLPAFLEVA